MGTAIDTNVISALWDASDTLYKTAQAALEEAQKGGSLAICGAVHAELLAAPGRTEEFVDKFCEEAGIVVEWELGERVWRVAGTAFQHYAARRRKQKDGHARRILTDFLIGAHAVVGGYRLLTLDAGIYQAAFPRLRITSL